MMMTIDVICKMASATVTFKGHHPEGKVRYYDQIICLHPEGKVRYYDSDHLSVHRAFEIATNIACQQVNSLTSQSDLIILPIG